MLNSPHVSLQYVHDALRAKGVRNLGRASDESLKMSCLFHKDNNPSAFVVMRPGERFYKCFSCGKFIPLRLFLRLLQLDDLLVLPENFETSLINISAEAFDNRVFKEDTADIEEGMRILYQAHDYRLYPQVVKYLENRLGKGFKLPPNTLLRFHPERKSLLIKGVEDAVVERFSKKAKVRFMNYGKGAIFHHYTRPQPDIMPAEGIFDYWKLWNAGFNACAIMTSNLTAMSKMRQIIRMCSNGRFFLFLDNDNAGRSGTFNLRDRLTAYGKFPKVLEYLDDTQKDPGSLSYDDIYTTVAWNCYHGGQLPECSKTFSIPEHIEQGPF